MIARLIRSPLAWILCAAAALRISGLFWGLPAADGWDNDGFAPRNFLTALALTYTPGAYFTYPPLHAFILAILTLPGIVLALFHVPSFTQADVIGEFTKPGYMTFFAVVARLVSLAMSLGIIWGVGEMARLVAGARAGLFAAGACALGVVLTYYGQVSNLDVPYLFWSVLSLLFVMRAVIEQRPKLFWWAALLAAAAVATKDQAYAVFLLSLPLFLAIWFAADPWPRRNARAVIVTLLLGAGAALAALLLVDGAITNPSGFARRVAFLVGPASADYAAYTPNFAGWLTLLADAGRYFLRGYGVVAVALMAAGAALHLRSREDAPRWVAGLLPLLAIISFTLCFNFSALRSDHRFLLPQAILACFYIGIAAAWLAFHANRWLAMGARLALAATALFALHNCIAINAAMLLDPRYDAERWMAAHMKPGDTIEIYGQNIFQPRFPAHARVSRVGQGALKLRNPLPGVTERQTAFSGTRPPPKFIVVSGNWVRRYLNPPQPLGAGRVYPKTQRDALRDRDGRSFFSALSQERPPYRLVHVARYDSRIWPVMLIHDSLAEPIGIYQRVP